MVKEVRVPDIGGYSNVEVIEVMVAAGDTIKKEDSLIALETEKASMEIPSPYAGKIKELKVKVGDKVSQDDLIVVMDVEEQEKSEDKEKTEKAEKAEAGKEGSEKTEKPSKEKAEEKSGEEKEASAKKEEKPSKQSKESTEKSAEKPSEKPTVQTSAEVHAGPGVRRFARELGVNLANVPGTGKNKRIVFTDVKEFVKNIMSKTASQAISGPLNLAPWPTIDHAKFGEIEKKPLPRIKKLSGSFLHRNWVMVPHVTQFDEADITEMEAFRKESQNLAQEENIRLTPLVFIMKAVVTALKAFPNFNSSLDANAQELIFKHYFHIGVAVDTPNGLVVPVVRNVDQKGLFELAKELGEISAVAREGKLKAEDMQGSSFSISSLGGIGGTYFTPIVNVPDVAILGVSKAQMKPIYIEGEFKPRLILPLSLSYDHRVIDGAEAVRFTTFLVKQLSDVRRLLL